MVPMINRRIGLVAALSLVLVACAAENPPASQDGAPASEAVGSLPSTGASDPSAACELLTAGEIAEIVGNPVDDGTSLTSADCDWGSDPNDTSASVLLSSAGTEDICANALADDPDQVAVEGLGSPAFWIWSAPQGGVGTVSICRGSQFILVTVSGGLDDTSDESLVRGQAEELARLVLERSP